MPGSRSIIKRELVKHHRRLSHNRRVQIISGMLMDTINRLHLQDSRPCVDIGCGDMQIAEIIGHALPTTTWKCLDLYSAPETGGKWSKYETFDGRQIKYKDDSFNLSLLVDVLHHSNDAPALLREAARISSFVIIKDHFKYGLYSGMMLRAMDWFGNWGYDVKSPGKYFTQHAFRGLCDACGLEIVELNVGMDLYEKLKAVRVFLRPEWHFIAVLKRKESPAESRSQLTRTF